MSENKEDSTPEIIQNRRPQGGGKREGAGRPKMPTTLDGKINDIIEDIESLKFKLIKVNGFLGDIQSKRLQLYFKKELECLQSPIEKILTGYQEAGY